MAVVAVGALAIGRLAIGVLAIKRGQIGKLTIEELEVGRLRVPARARMTARYREAGMGTMTPDHPDERLTGCMRWGTLKSVARKECEQSR